MTRILTYPMPDELYLPTRTLGKTSTQEYIGPDSLWLYLNEDGRIINSFAPDEVPPAESRGLDETLVEFVPETDEDYIKIMILYSHWTPKEYEISVGPADDPNIVVTDPTDIIMIFDEVQIVEDYTAPLQFRDYERYKDRSDDFIRSVRDGMLLESDGRVAPDMPEDVKQAWLTYRQKLRDFPVTYAAVPNWLVRFPLSPDQQAAGDVEFEDENIDVIMIADRTAEDQAAIDQLPDGCD